MAYQDQFDLANTPTFKERIEIAILKASAAVQAEDETGLSLPSGTTLTAQELHDKRSELAYEVLRNPTGYAVLFAKAVASDPNTAGIDSESTDSDLLFTVNALWSAFAVNGANV